MTDARTFLDRVDARTNAAQEVLEDLGPRELDQAVIYDLPAMSAALRAVLDLLDEQEDAARYSKATHAPVHHDDLAHNAQRIRDTIATALEDA